MKLVSISEKLLREIKKEYKKFNIIEFGNIDITNHILLNEINNMSFSSEIYSFTVNQLEENNFISKQHLSRIFELNKKYLKVHTKKDINKIDTKLKTYSYQIDLNSTSTASTSDIANYYNQYYEANFFEELFEYNYNGIGKGELFLGILTQLSNADTIGDLKLNDKNIEVKSNFSRFKHVNGYNSVRLAWNYLKEQLTYLIDKKDLKNYKLEDPNNWNFNKSNIDWIIQKLNVLSDINIFNLLYSTFKLIYCDITKELLSKYCAIFKDNIIQNKGYEFLDNFLFLQFEYYQYLTKFNYIILIDKSKYLIIKDVDDLRRKLLFINYSSFSWKEDRNCVFSISLKK